ncbi:serine protease inhibitor 77Ba [Manduca sexta]|uniref:serine protease inhibitor 77Ba n=1 Tax=Manduca sexta TaxID=7130 RepID=UPI00188DDE1E|nr:serine protease inhibitor 77Ba [Manduca sexta]
MARILIIFLLISVIIHGTFAQCNQNTARGFMRRALYEFTTDLVARINQETESHFVASGLSSWTLLSAMSFGAGYETLSELQRVLRLHPHKCFNNKFFEILQNSANNDTTIMERSSTVYVNDKLAVHDKFKNSVEGAGLCEVKNINLDDVTQAAAIINDYVREATHEAIDEIVTAGDLDRVRMVMIDALYFRGAWKIPFPYDDTENSAFYNHLGHQIGDVNLMFVSGSFHVISLDQIRAKVLELPYGNDGRYSMLLFLPYPDVSISNVIDSLKKINLASIYLLFEEYGQQTVHVQIPRFKITSDINNLKELLMDMGLRALFDSSLADFSELTDYPLYVSNFIQKVDVEVSEEGTVAAAATEAMFEPRMMPEQFVANKPFLFMIVDKQIDVMLFTGAYSKPSIY